LAENFGQTSTEETAVEIHLPEPFLGVQVSLSKKKIQLVGRMDVWNPVSLPKDPNGFSQTTQRDLSLVTR
jgi:hypothetical protein